MEKVKVIDMKKISKKGLFWPKHYFLQEEPPVIKGK